MLAWARSLVAGLSLVVAHCALALDIQPYSAEALDDAQRAGRPVALFFHADWCPVCQAQRKVFEQLQAEAGLDITLLQADFDRERELRRRLKVRTQSTLVVFRGAQERMRSVASIDADTLRTVLKSAY